MPLIKQKDLYKLLKIPMESDASAITARQNFGPDEVDNWALLEGEENFFINKKIQNKAQGKPKVIFSYPLLSEIPISEIYVPLFNALINYCDFYLWPGENISLTECKPISTIHEFLDKRDLAFPATKQHISKYLSAQNSKYIIIDMVELNNLVLAANRYTSRDILPSNILDLTNLFPGKSETIEKLKYCVETESIKAIKILSLTGKEIELLLRLFPNLEDIAIVRANQNWVNLNFRYFGSLNVYLEQYFGPEIIVPPVLLNSLRFINCPQTIITSYTMIPIQGIHSISDFANREKETDLVITENNKEMLQKLIYFPDLINLIIRNININNMDLGLIPIKNLTIEFAQLNASLILPKTLERLVVKSNAGQNNLKYLNFKNCTKLESFVGFDASFSEMEFLPKTLTQLTLFSMEQLKEFDVTQFPLLTDLYLHGMRVNFDFSKLPELQVLRLDACELENLNFKNHAKLKEVKIDNNLNALNLINLNTAPNLENVTLSNLDNSITVDMSKCNKVISLMLNEIEAQFIYPPSDVLIVANLRSVNEKILNNLLDNQANLRQLVVEIPSYSDVDDLYVGALNKLELFELDYARIEILNLNDLSLIKVIKLHVNHEDMNIPKLINLTNDVDLRLFSLNYTNKKIGLDVKGCHRLNTIITDTMAPNIITQEDLNSLIVLRNANVTQTASLSSVAILSFTDDPFMLDSNTGENKDEYQARGNIRISIETKDSDLDANLYRFMTYDKVQYDPNTKQIGFIASDIDDDLVKVQGSILNFNYEAMQFEKDAMVQHNQALALIQAESLSPDKKYPLATHQPINFKALQAIYSNPPNSIELYWHEKGKKLYFKPLVTGQIEILYRYTKNSAYDSFPMELKISNTPLLPQPLITALLDFIPKHKDLNFILDDDLSINEKVLTLIKYCKNFTASNLTVRSGFDIDNLFAMIAEKKGTCRHRTFAFVILSQLMNLESVINRNEIHAFPEIPGDNGWFKSDLGGSDVNDVTPSNTRRNLLMDVMLPSIPNTRIVAAATPMQERYNESMKEMFEHKSLVLENLLKTNFILAPLIKVEAGKMRLVKQEIIEYLKSQNQAYIYIDTAKDLKRYFKAQAIINGKRVTASGPLKIILQNTGFVIINWSNFSAREQAIYKSIIDYAPTLFGESISKKVKIIGLTNPGKEACSAFLSRCQSYSYSLEMKNESKFETYASEVYELDLFELSNWRKLLFGDIRFSNNQIEFEQSDFIAALKAGKTIRIYNPPLDPDFDNLLQQIKDEKRIFYNGQWIENLTAAITIHSKPYILTLENVALVRQTEEKIDANKITHIGIHNWHELFEKLLTDIKTLQGKTAPGFLANYKEGDIFYITQAIAKADWARVLAVIQKDFPTKKFKFMLAPGAAVQGVMQNDTKLDYAASSVVVSNDRDYWIKRHLAETINATRATLVIDVNQLTTFSDLVAKLRIQIENGDEFRFLFEDKILLRALKSSPPRDIIINGELSIDLYQQLLPLFQVSPFFEINGNYYNDIPNRIIAVMPLAAKMHLTLNNYTEKYFNLDDYKNEFPHYHRQIAQLAAFYNLANQLTHADSSMPPAPALTYKKLKQLLSKLEDRFLHPHNPIKGIFHYHYPKGSEEYAYLNVCAKLLFSPGDKTPLREQKLLKLLRQYKIDSLQSLLPHAYKLLNCFSGKDLSDFFGNDQPAPILTDGQLNKLLHICQQEYKHITSTKSHLAKRNKQLEYLINDANTPFIFCKGEPGVGKTFTVSAIQTLFKDKVNFYPGEEGLLRWLKDDSTAKKILLLDEINLSPNGSWDFLKGLSRDSKTLIYKGVEYSLTSSHKIVATGNPESFPGRYYHDVILEEFELLNFKMLSHDELKAQILLPMLGKDRASYADELLRIFALIKNANPLITYSTRNLQNLAHRFLLILESVQDVYLALTQSAISEFAAGILDIKKRENFIDAIQDMFNITIESNSNPIVVIKSPNRNLIVSTEIEYLVDAIKQDLQLRQRGIEEKQTYTMGTLIEGPAGLGKSTLYKAILEEAGFTAAASNTQKRYYEISVGDEKSHAILLKAFNEGAVVILDELNLDKSLEELLNQLLEGRDLNGKPAKIPGFMVFASQNPSYELDREPISQALRNRMHMMYIEEYSQIALISLAAVHGIQDPVGFIEIFNYYRKKNPEEINMRTFYTVLSEMTEKSHLGPHGIFQSQGTVVVNTQTNSHKPRGQV